MKKIIFGLIIIVLAFGFYKLLSTPPGVTPTGDKNYDNPDFILFYGDTCPHCKNVEDWIQSNKAEEKLKINKKEVYKNTQNQEEMTKLVNQYCPELNTDGIGVPLGFDPINKKCIQGDTPIIDFLSQKVK
ncbi:MAG: hypothetical protein WC895_01500 [Candidatus Shapirobacteria bacterium]|jgi:glutaredoxin